MSATELGIDFVVESPPCAKCGHRHAGGPCREVVQAGKPLHCICWNYEAPRVDRDTTQAAS